MPDEAAETPDREAPASAPGSVHEGAPYVPVPPAARVAAKAHREARAAKKKIAQANMKKALAAKDRMDNRRALIKEKIAKGLPITEEELRLASHRNKTLMAMAKGTVKLTAEPAVVIKPHTINALRVVVEQTAAKHAYNPIEGLLQELMAEDDDGNKLLPVKDRVAIHKTLLPYLMPQIGPAKEENVAPPAQAPKITIKSFTLPASDGRPIHESKKTGLAEAVEREEERPEAEATALAFEPAPDEDSNTP